MSDYVTLLPIMPPDVPCPCGLKMHPNDDTNLALILRHMQIEETFGLSFDTAMNWRNLPVSSWFAAHHARLLDILTNKGTAAFNAALVAHSESEWYDTYKLVLNRGGIPALTEYDRGLRERLAFDPYLVR